MNEKLYLTMKRKIETDLKSLLEDTKKKSESLTTDDTLINNVLIKVATERANALKTQKENSNLVLQMLEITQNDYELLIDEITTNIMTEYLNNPITTNNNIKKEDSKNEKLIFYNKIESEFKILLDDTIKRHKKNNLDETSLGLLIAKTVAEYSNKLKYENDDLIEILKILHINKDEHYIQIDNIVEKLLEEYLEVTTEDVNSNKKKRAVILQHLFMAATMQVKF